MDHIEFKSTANDNYATMLCDKTVHSGMFVQMKDNFTVTKDIGNNEIFGYCVRVQDGYAVVQLAGYIETYCHGKVSLGTVGLVTKAENRVMAYEMAKNRYKVVYCDGHKVGFFL